MKTFILIKRPIHVFIAFLLVKGICTGQDLKSLEAIINKEDLSRTNGKITKSVMGIGATANIRLMAGLNDYNACQEGTFTTHGIDIDIAWYNTADETGKYMLQILKDMNGVNQIRDDFRDGSGFNTDEAAEENVEGGTLWIITQQDECMNEITGPTGKTRYATHLRYFNFNGSVMLKIELNSKSKPEKMKDILIPIVQQCLKFDFASFNYTVATE
jgi:hypothetical protein